MSDTTDLSDGIAARIASLASGFTFAWSPTGLYSGAQVGGYRKVMPDGATAPDRAFSITVVPQGDDPSMPLGQTMVQIRARGQKNNPTDPDDILDAIFNVLHGTTGLVFGGLTVIQMNRRVRAQLGQDDSKRWETADQYYLDVDYPPTSFRPNGGSW